MLTRNDGKHLRDNSVSESKLENKTISIDKVSDNFLKSTDKDVTSGKKDATLLNLKEASLDEQKYQNSPVVIKQFAEVKNKAHQHEVVALYLDEDARLMRKSANTTEFIVEELDFFQIYPKGTIVELLSDGRVKVKTNI